MPDAREIIREAIERHEGFTLRVRDARWHVDCQCNGWSAMVANIDGDVLHSAHRAEAVERALVGLLIQPGGETRQIFRCYDLVSGGAYQTGTREELEDFCLRNEAHKPDPFGPPPHPKEHQTATETTWPDGSVHTGPWQPTDTREPSP